MLKNNSTKISLRDLASIDHQAYCKYISMMEDGHLTLDLSVNLDTLVTNKKNELSEDKLNEQVGNTSKKEKFKYEIRESNPRQLLGRQLCYHYTNPVTQKSGDTGN